jgi:superfamily II DNA/RNA helicase
MAGKDVLIQAQTGSGKTLAYSLPILSCIDPCRSAIQAVIVVPTRELALQVTKELRKLCANCKPKMQVMTVMSGSINKRYLFCCLFPGWR